MLLTGSQLPGTKHRLTVLPAAWNEASTDSLVKAWKQLLPESPDTPELSEDSTRDDEGWSDVMKGGVMSRGGYGSCFET